MEFLILFFNRYKKKNRFDSNSEHYFDIQYTFFALRFSLYVIKFLSISDSPLKFWFMF